jgi:hypothetical protein
MTNWTFGPAWDAPDFDELPRWPDPDPLYEGARCLRCDEGIMKGDQGFIQPYIGGTDLTLAVGGGEGYILVPIHRECQLIGVLGHMVGVCHCTGYDTDTRASAMEAMRRFEERFRR